MKAEFICSLRPELRMFTLLAEREDDGCGGFLLCLLISYSFSLPARGQFCVWTHASLHACPFHAPALLLCECSEPVRSAGANEMYH